MYGLETLPHKENVEKTKVTCCTWGCLVSRSCLGLSLSPWHHHTRSRSNEDHNRSTPGHRYTGTSSSSGY